jgi:hypothetical protein
MGTIKDINGDGVVSDEDIRLKTKLTDLENKDKKEDQLRQMAWAAMFSMIVFTGLLYLPFIDAERINTLSEILSTFYLAQAAVVAAFFGANAWITKK